MNYRIVIPARYASTRLPGKPLRDCAGKSLLQRVWEQACKSSAEAVVIATDEERICEHAEAFGATVVMTGCEHRSGSDRIAEAVTKLDWPDATLLVNLQGDEPLMPPACLDQVAALLSGQTAAAVASLWWPVASAKEFANPNAVKLVADPSGRALYFSRAAIPGCPAAAGNRWQEARRHIGLYAYRVGTLKTLTALQASPLETIEQLEQLRWLEAGHAIVVARAEQAVPAGVDTEADLQAVSDILKGHKV